MNFDLIQADRNNLNDIKKKLVGDFLIISKEQNAIESYYLVLKNSPLKISKLIEIINIEFLKKKFDLQSDLISAFEQVLGQPKEQHATRFKNLAIRTHSSNN